MPNASGKIVVCTCEFTLFVIHCSVKLKIRTWHSKKHTTTTTRMGMKKTKNAVANIVDKDKIQMP